MVAILVPRFSKHCYATLWPWRHLLCVRLKNWCGRLRRKKSKWRMTIPRRRSSISALSTLSSGKLRLSSLSVIGCENPPRPSSGVKIHQYRHWIRKCIIFQVMHVVGELVTNILGCALQFTNGKTIYLYRHALRFCQLISGPRYWCIK